MKIQSVAWGVIVVIAISSRVVPAQCGAGGGSAATHHNQLSDRDRAIQGLLADRDGRGALMQAILNDPPFMRELMGQILELPEWRALAADRLGFVPVTPDAAPGQSPEPQPSAQPNASAGRRTPSTPTAPKVLYRCPMHTEVTSDQPGKCWKCGMTLERVS